MFRLGTWVKINKNLKKQKCQTYTQDQLDRPALPQSPFADVPPQEPDYHAAASVVVAEAVSAVAKCFHPALAEAAPHAEAAEADHPPAGGQETVGLLGLPAQP